MNKSETIRGWGKSQSAFAQLSGDGVQGREAMVRHRKAGDVPRLWFHHVPWDARLSSGRTVWEELEFRYNRGVTSMDQMADTWQSLEGEVAPEVHASVMKRLQEERAYARQWLDACVRYFSGFALKAETSSVAEDSSLSERFQNPPHPVKPSGYWWWLYNNVDKASIKVRLNDRDLGVVESD